MEDSIFDEIFQEFENEANKAELDKLNDECCRALAYDILRAENICVVTGAGISVSSGIPDFRSKEGIWKKYDPQVYGSMNGFMAHPQNFWKMSMALRETMEGKVPTIAHEALTKLQKLGKLQNIITQNVDGLHQMSGSENVHEVHGTTKKCKCIECGYEIDFDELLKEHPNPIESIPRCPKCNNLVKMDVVLFGEELNNDVFHDVHEIVENCDLMLVIGCSMEVQPVNLFPLEAKRNNALVAMVNVNQTRCDCVCDYVIRGSADEMIPKIVNYVDQFMGFTGKYLNFKVPLGYAKRVFDVVKEFVCEVVSNGIKQIQISLDQLKEICGYDEILTKVD